MTTLLLDFDGVLNFELSLKAYKRVLRDNGGNPNLYGDPWGLSILYRGLKQKVNFSTELVRALNTLRVRSSLNWVWLTTWESDTYEIDKRLRTCSDSYIKWDYRELETRNAKKYVEFLKIANSGEKVVWVDDEATVLYNPSDVPDASNVLVVKPSSDTGLTRVDMQRITDFLDS